ncbi:MAG: 2-hydroxymuconate tautomerase family protein [Acidobacteriota bacterium]|nr:2-hydroxymuconate tautomerase family protein [Acidobacteriota bacterium]
MPYVNVRITKEEVTTEQKSQVVAEITDTLVRVLGKKPEHIHIIIDEIELENWGFAGMLTDEYLRREKETKELNSENQETK